MSGALFVPFVVEIEGAPWWEAAQRAARLGYPLADAVVVDANPESPHAAKLIVALLGAPRDRRTVILAPLETLLATGLVSDYHARRLREEDTPVRCYSTSCAPAQMGGKPYVVVLHRPIDLEPAGDA
ncbi:MAG: hypothetical protein HYV09_35790 [Deltaproteobacteria bacterium]|nr:hypothetical protein [Deltaproteobacteria bacterium]